MNEKRSVQDVLKGVLFFGGCGIILLSSIWTVFKSVEAGAWKGTGIPLAIGILIFVLAGIGVYVFHKRDSLQSICVYTLLLVLFGLGILVLFVFAKTLIYDFRPLIGWVIGFVALLFLDRL